MNPLQQLSSDQLQQLGTHSLHQIAKSALGTMTTFRLILGRCLLAMTRGQHYLEFGCSSALHYATSQLGMDIRQARECRRLARLLESLPRLTVAAEEGWLCWSKLREVARVATPEDEEQWLQICARCTYAEIERMVAGRTQSNGREAVATELRLQLDPEARQMLEQVFRLISQAAGSALPPAQALELLCADYLARKRAQAEATSSMARSPRPWGASKSGE